MDTKLLNETLKLCGELIIKCTETITEYEKQMAQKNDELAKLDKDYKRLALTLEICQTEKLVIKGISQKNENEH